MPDGKPRAEAHVTEQMARSFILGDVDESERERIERLFLTDPEIRDSILLVEESLFDDYLEGNLNEGDAEKFYQLCASSAVQGRKLRIAQSIKEHAIKEHAVANRPETPAPAAARERRRVSWQLWRRPDFRLWTPLVASMAIVVIVVAVWLGLRLSRATHEDDA